MIRRIRTNDLDAVMQIWLTANTEAHSFIPAEYWKNNETLVRSLLPQAEVLVFEDDNGTIDGFLGLMEDYIAGLFVRKEARSKGVGKALLDPARQSRNSLRLQVYEENRRALRFYQREGFVVYSSQIDEETSQKELCMSWKKREGETA